MNVSIGTTTTFKTPPKQKPQMTLECFTTRSIQLPLIKETLPYFNCTDILRRVDSLHPENTVSKEDFECRDKNENSCLK